MSSFANFDLISRYYDSRPSDPTAAPLEKFLFESCMEKELQDMHILDVAGGTGNFARYLLKNNAGQMTIIDGSQGMLDIAKEKLKIFSGRYNIQYTLLPDIPYPDDHFDAAMINMSLHHFNSKKDENIFKGMGETLKATYRVLKPGGVLAIQEFTPEQFDGMWFTSLVPSAKERYRKFLPDLGTLLDILRETGFKISQCLNVYGSDWYYDYGNLNGPFDEKWRNKNSFWTECTDREVEEAINKVTAMKDKDELEQFYKDNDKSFIVGGYFLIAAQK